VQAFRVGGTAAGGSWRPTSTRSTCQTKPTTCTGQQLRGNRRVPAAQRPRRAQGGWRIQGRDRQGGFRGRHRQPWGSPHGQRQRLRGTVSMGTGATPAAGDAVSIAIPAGVYPTAPNGFASAGNFNTSGRSVHAYAVSATEIRLGFGRTPAKRPKRIKSTTRSSASDGPGRPSHKCSAGAVVDFTAKSAGLARLLLVRE
jgi:hypothetical protein